MIFVSRLVSTPAHGSGGGSPGPDGRHDANLGVIAMALFLGSLSVLFAASILLYVLMRARAETWPPAGTPPLPAGIWVSTALILACSVTIHLAVHAIKRDRQRGLRIWLGITGGLALAFLIAQVVNWFELTAAGLRITNKNAFGFLFYFLTGVHAAHVLGGFVPLGIVLANALRGRYSADKHAGVAYCAAYWHFLDAVWLVLLGVIYLV